MESELDYTAMSGAEFSRAVGADPAKWAAAFVQRSRPDTPGAPKTDEEKRWYMTGWFRDAMDAAAKAAKVRLDGD